MTGHFTKILRLRRAFDFGLGSSAHPDVTCVRVEVCDLGSFDEGFQLLEKLSLCCKHGETRIAARCGVG